MDDRELENILKDEKRLNAQDGGTKDYIMDTTANLLVMTASQIALGNKRFEKHNLNSIRENLEKYDNADRYVYDESRIGTYNRFKNKTLPFLMNSLKRTIKYTKLNPELWNPVLELFFEKAQDYLSLGE